jgi:hypothetical protein
MTIDIDIRNDNHDPVGNPDYEWHAVLRIELDADNDASIEVCEVHGSENGTPMDVWHKKVLRWSARNSSGVVSLAQLEDLKTKIAPLLETIAANREVVWNGSNHVGRVTSDEAQEAVEAVEHIVAEFQWQDDQWSLWDAREWIGYDWLTTAKDLGLTHDATEDTMKAAEAKLANLAHADCVLLVNTDDAVQWIVDKLQDEVEVEDDEEPIHKIGGSRE